jgi:uncharacterized membrane protein (DUF2068 family)
MCDHPPRPHASGSGALDRKERAWPWGWIHLIIGVIMILAAWGLFTMAGWARWTAVVFATLNAGFQVGTFSAFPLWSLVAIALDVIVIYQLTVNWETR